MSLEVIAGISNLDKLRQYILFEGHGVIHDGSSKYLRYPEHRVVRFPKSGVLSNQDLLDLVLHKYLAREQSYVTDRNASEAMLDKKLLTQITGTGFPIISGVPVMDFGGYTIPLHGYLIK